MSFPSNQSSSHNNGQFPEDDDQGGEEVWPAAVWPSNDRAADNVNGIPRLSLCVLVSSHCPVASSPIHSPSAAAAAPSFNGLYTVVFRIVYDHQPLASRQSASVFTPAPSTTGSSPQPVVDYNPCCFPTTVVAHHGYDAKSAAAAGGGGGGHLYGTPHDYPSVMYGSTELREWQYDGGVDQHHHHQRASMQGYTHQQQQQHCGGVMPVPTPAGGSAAAVAAGNTSGGVYLPAAFFTSTPLHPHHGLQFAHTPGHPHSGAHFAPPYGATPLPAAYTASSAAASPPHHMGFTYYNSADRHHSFYMSSTATGNSSPTPDASPVAAMMEKVSEEELRSAMPQQ
ncbi:hypothetical protein FOL47_004948 [Perkinsus chesapeaki]|uniref:Uncharacterized protein n=1 Tax=Perkinsus chesapeaki TaxID=330153 RepID=A0A7J6MZK5_PERCH|nr:hypothetical protein FOL47_004948 [Perkinsus chesapeaki]